jgi:two-component system phosphate regulon sensor histidine kinase PhoR
LNRLVKELLRLSQLEANQYILHPEEIRVSDLFEELGKLYHSSALKKQINLQTKIDPADANIFADKNGVLQILSNLLSNAIKYSPKGSKIDLIYEATEDQGMFEVKDTGVGISPSQLERIFERFYRVDRSRSREEGGTGLGLAIVKHLVQLLGGEIQVESEEGVGSKFVFRIPKISLSS